MSTFREIDERITALVDEETGELLDAEEFERLQMERAEKCENMALWAIQLKDDAESIKREVARLTARQKAAERKAEQLRDYLGFILNGEKLKTPLVSVSYRTSRAVEVEDPEMVLQWAMREEHEDCIRYKQPELNKVELKALMDQGVEIPGAKMVTNTSTTIR